MSDEEIEAKISLFIDGELDPSERALVQMRIDSDPRWKEEFDRLRKTSVAMQNFFAKETASAGADPAERDQAVKRIVVESTMLLRRDRSTAGKIARMWRKNGVFIVLALVAVVALAVALRENWMHNGGGDDAKRLLQGAAPSLDKKNVEVKLDFSKAEGIILGPLFASGNVPNACTIETDDAGRFHLRFPNPNGVQTHFGFDGERYWTWQSNASVVHTFTDGDRAEAGPARVLHDVWKKIDESIRRAAGAAEDAKIAGRELVREGADEWTKVDATMKGILAGRGHLWLDDQRRVRRVSVHGIVVDIAPRALSPEDFSPKAWAPGAAIEELKQ